MHYLLFYKKAADYAERQAPLAAAHRAYLRGAVRQGKLLLGGSLADPVDGSAVLLFQSGTLAAVEAFAAFIESCFRLVEFVNHAVGGIGGFGKFGEIQAVRLDMGHF